MIFTALSRIHMYVIFVHKAKSSFILTPYVKKIHKHLHKCGRLHNIYISSYVQHKVLMFTFLMNKNFCS